MGNIILSHKEIDRLTVIQNVISKQLTQAQAAAQLQLCVRQVKRLVRAYRLNGVEGLISGHRLRPPNNQIAHTVRSQAITLIQAYYSDFSPTFAHEKLTQLHGIQCSVETLRKWMTADGLWKTKARKKAHIHPSRPRRSCLGELIQIDGSPHAWFENRGPVCCLIVFIDDATSRLMALRFIPAETTQAYLATLKTYLNQHGRPVALYSDKHSIFRLHLQGKDHEPTQFARAVHALDIELICANTPQAKGRVERANQTLQDRLVKELRLAKIDDIDSANNWLPEFIKRYNERFAVAPESSVDAHRQVLHTPAELELILSQQYLRVLSKNLTLQFCNQEYQIQNYGKGYRLRGAKVTVCRTTDDKIILSYQGKRLDHTVFNRDKLPMVIADGKTIHEHIDRVKQKQKRLISSYVVKKPSAQHPWRRAAC
jgi:hypothetical protein